jgi:segregation and condensation protein B
MVPPPKLRLVTRDGGLESVPDRDEPESDEARELKRAMSEVEAVEAGNPVDAEQRAENLRILEALLFASATPLDESWLAGHLRHGGKVEELLADLRGIYAMRGVNLVRVAGKWVFRTAEDLSYLLEKHAVEERRLSRAALETLSIVAYHQPVTRAEIEEIRGVTTSAGTLDILMEAGWIRPRGRRRAPGKPLTYGTTDSFLAQFGLDTVKDLPGLSDLKAAGLLDGHLPPGFVVPDPTAVAALMPDELPLEEGGDEEEEASADEDVEPLSEDDLPDDGGTAKPD